MKLENVYDIYPLSPTQAGMLFHSLYAPDSGVYFNQMSLQFVGELDLPRFQQAWQRVVERHTILRTGFVWEDVEKPLQIVYRQVPLHWDVQDWRHWDTATQATQAAELLQAERRRGFDLHHPPLRYTCLRLGEQRYQFIWHWHHILFDGWSLPILFEEVFNLYNQPTKRLPTPYPYRDYIAWLQQQDIQKAEAFWHTQLAGFRTPTPLIVDQRQQATENENATNPNATHHLQLPVLLTRQLNDFARQHRLTLNTLLQGAWALLLGRYSREEEVLFGVTVSGRPTVLRGMATRVGLFINTLPLRVNFPSDGTLLPWLQQLQTQQMMQDEFAYTPLVEIKRWSEIPAHSPLFESILVFENYPLEVEKLQQTDTLRLEAFLNVEQTNYPLSLVVSPGDTLNLLMNYDTGRFDTATIERMAGHLQTLLEGIIANPNQRLRELPLLTPAERHQLLVEWNETQVDYPHDQCIHQLFEAQVARTPDAVAVVGTKSQLISHQSGVPSPTASDLEPLTPDSGLRTPDLGLLTPDSGLRTPDLGLLTPDSGLRTHDLGLLTPDSLTYAELNACANQLAHHLQSLGVGPDVLVGICVERSIEMVIGLLAILKAGGAYVPLDPAYPQERLAFMLQDANPPVLLTQAHLKTTLPATTSKLICLDQDWNEIASEPNDNLAGAVQPDHLAYVIYTSGSTGRPKGTMLEHRNVVNYLTWAIAAYEVERGSGALVSSSFAFDATITSLFTPLLTGRSITLLPESDEIESLCTLLLTKADYSLIKITPAHLQILSQLLPPMELTQATRYCVIGGEALISSQLAWWQQYAPTIRLINEYGPTETTVGCSIYDGSATVSGAVPIGRPIANSQLYLLDQQGQPVPIGVSGELYIGGAGVGRGYLNRPELTQEKFIANPFSTGKLYKTGDLARWLPDGNIEYLGRLDQQVKLRGFRIELGEIEAVLAQHPAVQEAVVIVREDTPGEKRLVAYVVQGGKGAKGQSEEGDLATLQLCNSTTLRSYLQDKLPEYMVPSAFILLAALPLTPNGKVDRNAFPAPDASSFATKSTYTPPSTPTEVTLAAIWSAVLGLEQVSIHDSFFELGGHSLLATQVVSRIRQNFAIELPLRTLFTYPTIEELGKRIQLNEAIQRMAQAQSMQNQLDTTKVEEEW